MAPPPVRLIPAQPLEKDEGKEYMRRIAWRWIFLGMAALLALVALYQIKERQKADALRTAIIRVHSIQLGTVAERYRALRERIERLVISAASAKPDDFADDLLKVEKLRGSRGLYLRMRFSDAVSGDKVARGVAEMKVDSVAECLGLKPGSVQDLYQKGDFLMADWDKIVDARTSNNVMRLRVIEAELSLRIKRDLTEVQKLLDPDWLLLVLQQGQAGQRSLVDIFIWDLHIEKPLLRARVQADGLLVPFAFRSKGAPPVPRVKLSEAFKGKQREAAGDCSIAAQIKAFTGSAPTDFESEAPPLERPPAPRPASAADAGEGPAVDTSAPANSAEPLPSPRKTDARQ